MIFLVRMPLTILWGEEAAFARVANLTESQQAARPTKTFALATQKPKTELPLGRLCASKTEM